MDLIKELENIEELPKDSNKILANLYYTHFRLMDKYNQILSGYDVTTQQSNILGIIKHFHPKSLTLQDIKKLLLEKNADASRIINRLIEKGLVKKAQDEKNQRKIKISLTENGLKLANQLEEEKLFRKFTSKFTLKEAKLFTELLSKLRQEI